MRVLSACFDILVADLKAARHITAELVAGSHPPGFKTKVVTALDIKGSWKEHPDLV